MKRVKGCLNSNCNEYKKTYYKESDEHCVKCGAKLSYVCQHPKCFKQLTDDTQERFCLLHIEERKDKKDKQIENIKKVSNGILAVGSVAIAVAGKAVVDIIRKK